MSKTNRRGRPPHEDVLTPTEWRVVHAIQHGMTNRSIAERRGVSLDAVKYHVANILAKLGLDDRKALRQWFRAPAGSALRRRASVVDHSVKLGPIGQISRTVKDIKQSETWFRDVLGLPHLYSFGNLAFFDCGGVRLYLTQEVAFQKEESILYFRVSDIEATHEVLKSRGVEFLSSPHLIHRHADGTEEWLAVCKDPDGRPLAIMCQAKRAAEE